MRSLLHLLLLPSLAAAAAAAAPGVVASTPALPPPPVSVSSFDVSGKNIVVTGARTAGSLGGAVAHALASAGASGLILVGRTPKSDGEEAGGGGYFEDELSAAFPGCAIKYVCCDLADAEACEALVAEADAIFDGQIHGLVNAAGVAFPRGTLEVS